MKQWIDAIKKEYFKTGTEMDNNKFKKIDIEKYKRKGLYNAFKDRDFPFFSITSHIDITEFKKFIEKNKYEFFLSISFLISKSINSIPEFRHRIIDGELFEFEKIDPGYTVLLDDETFSFCDSKYFDNFKQYRQYADIRIKYVKNNPDHSVDEKNNMFFITNVPWFSFTSVVHPYDKIYNSIPIITTGRYFGQENKLMMPVGVQAHHALVDGFHVGKFFNNLSELCNNPHLWLV